MNDEGGAAQVLAVRRRTVWPHTSLR